MATTPPTTYIWELGIDGDLVPFIANAGYMPGGFILTANSTLQRPLVLSGQTITFRVFDLSKGKVTKVESFTINPQIAVGPANINPLDHLQPCFVKLGNNPGDPVNQENSVFFGDAFPCWETEPVAVTANPPSEDPLKFLLTFFVQATVNVGQEPTLRLFAHDPEMVVGPHM